MGRSVERPTSKGQLGGGAMTYSYTQISQYLTCPRRYRHRYLDGWQEKDTRAAMLFGRAFERALASYFLREDAAAALFREWSACQNQGLQYSNGDTWDRMLQQGVSFWTAFAKMTAFAFASRDATCRSSSRGQSPARTISWPMSMPSERWTGRGVCSNGRQPPVAIQKNRTGCWLSIPNSSATPG